VNVKFGLRCVSVAAQARGWNEGGTDLTIR